MGQLPGRRLWNYLRTGETVGPQSGIGPALTLRNPFYPNEWFVDGQNGSDNADGLQPNTPLKTIGEVLTRIRSGDTIYLTGNFAEEAGETPQAVEDVSFIGLGGGRPRHADAARDGLANPFSQTNQNSGCSWRPPSSESGTTPLITVVRQGWTFENILFDAPTDAACVLLERNSDSGADEHDGSHATFRNCRFDGGHAGIDVTGGAFNVLIEDCVFRGLADGIRQVTATISTCLQWVVRRNYFSNNTNHIMVSASRWFLHDNFFDDAGTFGIDLINIGGTGSSNIVTKNYLAGDYSQSKYLPSGTDEWDGNFNGDNAETEVTNSITVANPAS